MRLVIISWKHNCPLSSDATPLSFLLAFPLKDVYLQLRVWVISCQNPCALCEAAARGIRRAGVEEAEKSTGEMTRKPLNKRHCSTLMVWEHLPGGRGSWSVHKHSPAAWGTLLDFHTTCAMARVRFHPHLSSDSSGLLLLSLCAPLLYFTHPPSELRQRLW